MLKFLPLKNQVIEERKKNNQILEKLLKKSADIEYIAMMCDVELEENADDEV